jgi:hypothetical protein
MHRTLNRLGSVASVLLGFGPGLDTQAADGIGSIQCTIAGVTNRFTVSPQAVETPREGLQLFAFTDFRDKAASLSLTIAAPRLGTFRLRDTPGMTLHWSRSTHSSSTADHYDARWDLAGTAMEVTLHKLGGIGEAIEGRFSGIVGNSLGQLVTLTNGTFCLVRSAPK